MGLQAGHMGLQAPLRTPTHLPPAILVEELERVALLHASPPAGGRRRRPWQQLLDAHLRDDGRGLQAGHAGWQAGQVRLWAGQVGLQAGRRTHSWSFSSSECSEAKASNSTSAWLCAGHGAPACGVRRRAAGGEGVRGGAEAGGAEEGCRGC